MTSKTPLARLILAKQNQFPDDPLVNSFSAFLQTSTATFSANASSADGGTVGNALTLSEIEWMAEAPGKNYEDCIVFLDTVASWIVPPTKTAKQLHEESQWISSGLPELDQLLHGGLRAGHLTEIVGRAGVGKSQFCMTMSAKLLHQHKRGVIYIDSERKFSSERFAQIIAELGGSSDDVDNAMLIRADDMDSAELLATLKRIELTLLEKTVGLIVVDSIAAITRMENNTVVDRQSNLAKIAAELKHLAETFRIPVIVTNQVLGVPSNSAVQGPIAATATPALGNTWHHVVNVRLQLTADDASAPARTLKVTKSPDASECTVQYTIGHAGIVSFRQAHVMQEWANVLSELSPAELDSL